MNDATLIPEIQNRNWYHECSRENAIELLQKVPNDFKKPVFLVRPSTTGEYAISLIFNSTITHILVGTQKFVTSKEKVMENVDIDGKKFFSVSQLIPFYMRNSLESYFPSQNITLGIPYREAILPPPTDISESIDKYNWFARINRETAEKILNRLPNSSNKTLFLVRPHMAGGFRISFLYNFKIEHLRIEILNFWTKSDKTSSKVYLNENKQFKNIEELINYYTKKKLTDVDPQLKTTLGVSYINELPESINETKAIVDYTPTIESEKSGEISLVKNQRYFIVKKLRPEWFMVYNQDGLIGYACAKYLQLI